jgi:hypothetical protein
MSSWKKFMGWAKILTVVFALSLLMFSFPKTAMADCGPVGDIGFKELPVQNGDFNYKNTKKLPYPAVVRSVKVCLEPPSATGRIEQILITGPDGRIEFGCYPYAVEQGTNLIRACGGPAVLMPGDTTYQAIGSGFTPENVRLTVNLSSDF